MYEFTDLPRLNGVSIKQVSFGQDCRERIVREVSDCLNDPTYTSFGDVFADRFTRLLAAKTDAKWWIEHRDINSNLNRMFKTSAEQLGRIKLSRGEIDETWTPDSY